MDCLQKIILVSNLKFQFLSSPPCLVFFLCSRTAHVISQLSQQITSKNSNLDIGKLMQTFFACFYFILFQPNVVVHLTSLIHIFYGVWTLAPCSQIDILHCPSKRPRGTHLCRLFQGVTTSRATSGERKKDRNTSGQRGNKFNNSYRDISVIVAENNSVVKPKYQQYTSLNKMLSNFSKVLMAHISFTAVLNNRGIGKGIGGIRKETKKNYIYVL